MNKGQEIETLYVALLESWNKRDASEFASYFTEKATAIGFDGSQYNGREEIKKELSEIFAHHRTASYVWKIREVLFLTHEVALLRSVVGMTMPGQSDINPAVSAIQTIISTKEEGKWRIALLQNTPAQFHMRPDIAKALGEELRQLLKKKN